MQLIVSPVLLPLGAAIQLGPAIANHNPAPVHQNTFSVINQLQVQAQVIQGAVPAEEQGVPRVVRGQPQQQAYGQVGPIVLARGQVTSGVVPGQPPPRGQGQFAPFVLARAPVPPDVQLGQHQPRINQPLAQIQVAQVAHPMQG